MVSPQALRLLDWYNSHRRDLPWRRSRDPYRIWLSEVMLQQTRVDTALPYYERFLERFPTVEDLAAADEEEVMALWSGLGYYRRARQLHQSARQVTAAGGALPSTIEGLRALPGIGPYTAAAIASIAFGIAEPVLDGNVERVVSRLLAAPEDPKSSAGRRALRERTRALLDPERPGDSNQALMELGATLCTPTSPRCLLCPLKDVCAARAEGKPERYPMLKPRRKSVRERRAAVVVKAPRGIGSGVLLFRRGDDEEVLAGTWELPWVALPANGGSEPESALIERKLLESYGGTWKLGSHRGRVRHGITYRSIAVEVYRAERAPGTGGDPGEEPGTVGFFDAEARRRLPLSSLVTKVLETVTAPPPPSLHRRG